MTASDGAEQHRLRAALRAFVAEKGGQHAAAELLGYSQPRINQILNNNDPVSLRLAKALAKARGCSVGDIMGGPVTVDRPNDAPAPGPPALVADRTVDGRVTYGSLLNWPELLAGAQEEEPTVPAWVWTKIATMRSQLDAPPTHLMIAELAVWVRRHESRYQPRPATATTGAHAAKPAKASGATGRG